MDSAEQAGDRTVLEDFLNGLGNERSNRQHGEVADLQAEFLLGTAGDGVLEGLVRARVTAETVGPHAGPRALAERAAGHQNRAVSAEDVARERQVQRRVSVVHLRLQRRADRLARLAEDIDEVSTAEEGRLSLAIDHMPVTDVLWNAAEGIRERYRDKGVNLVVQPDGAAGLNVMADQQRIGQVMTNLLTNALMHAGPGAPIEVRLGEEGDRAVIEVRDHGVGMDEATAACISRKRCKSWWNAAMPKR